MVDDLAELDMARFGHLTSVNKEKSSRPRMVECIFDTGAVLYIPVSMFDTLKLRFTLEKKD